MDSNIKKKLSEIMSLNQKLKIKTKMNVAGGVIKKKGENGEDMYLLIQRAADDHFPLMWEFPRGKCDQGKNEDLIHCMKREVKEETGLDVNPIGYIDNFVYVANGGKRESIQHNYLCEMKDENQKVKLSKEHDAYKWVISLGIVELSVMPEIKQTMSKVMNQDIRIIDYDESELYQKQIEEKHNFLNDKLNQIQE